VLEIIDSNADNPTMTITADAKKRVVLPHVRPGDCFQVEEDGAEIRLTRLEPVRPQGGKARLRRENGYLVAETERVVAQGEIRKAWDEFP
jgi:hypothetical protein